MGELGSLAGLLVAALLAGQLAMRIGLPNVVGQILAGMVLGPAVLGWLQPTQALGLAANLGVIVLMFLAGLECDFHQIKRHAKASLGIAVCGVLLPLLAFTALGLLWQQGLRDALFWGVIFAATSVSISVAVLQEFGQLKTIGGTVILGAAVADDLISIVLLSLFSSLFSANGQSLWVVVLEQLCYLGGLAIVIKWLVPAIIQLVVRFRDPVLLATVGLIIALLLAELAEVAHLSAVLGAFFAGIAVARTSGKATIVASTNLVGSVLLIPIFFVSVGLDLKLVTSWQGLALVGLLTVVAVLTKWIGCGLSAHWFGLDWGTSNIVGSGMISRGEMALIISQLGLQQHLLSSGLYSELTLVIVLTTIISPILLRWGLRHLQTAVE
ncbi:Na(), H() antiporter [Fructilactobacillus florum 8D]|uniref:Na(), H() antiporter n=1 Tax=Fructilactobacillus florum 8D TaxID=1221538 RepID=W9EFD9_9LACO|nr:cation:proton antiporter [Fructilactobacillus florum]EKK20597.1 Na(), H() antiporter [Fructilactobacillus florum 2F]ETO40797.1 Na(), H() antiporter [Fructilactobacillus florum 8D]